MKKHLILLFLISILKSENIYLKYNDKLHSGDIVDYISLNHSDYLITASQDKTIKIFSKNDLKNSAQINSLIEDGYVGSISNIATNKSESILAVCGLFSLSTNHENGHIRIYDLNSNYLKAVISLNHESKSYVTDLDFVNDNLLAAITANKLHFIDIEKYSEISQIDVPTNSVLRKVQVFNRGRDFFCLIFNEANELFIYDLNGKKFIKKIKFEGYISAVKNIKNKILITTFSGEIVLLDENFNFFHKKNVKKSINTADFYQNTIYYCDNDAFRALQNLSTENNSNNFKPSCYSYNINNSDRENKIFHDKSAKYLFFEKGNFFLINNNFIEKYDKDFHLINKVESTVDPIVSVKLFNDDICFGKKFKENQHELSHFKYTLEKSDLENCFNLKNFNISKFFKLNIDNTIDSNLSLIPSLNPSTGINTGILNIYENGKLSSKILRSYDNGGEHRTYMPFENHYIFSSGGPNGNIELFDKLGNTLIKFIGNNSTIEGMDYDKKYYISSSQDGVIQIWLLEEIKSLLDSPFESVLNPYFVNYFAKLGYSKKDLENSAFMIYNRYHIDVYMKIPKLIHPIVSIILNRNNEWIMWTPEGYFSASEHIAQYVGYHINQGADKNAIWIGMDKLYDHFFRPDLVKLKLQGEDISKYTNGVTYKEVLKNLPPTVSIDSVNGTAINSSDKKASLATATAKISFNVKENNGGSGLIRIYQEGKLVKTIGEGQVNRPNADVDVKEQEAQIDKKVQEAQTVYLAKLEDMVTKSLGREFNTNELVETVDISSNSAISSEGTHTIELPLKAGNNTISIEAFNKTNTVASYRDSVNINASIKPKEPKIYAIALGVNEFEQSSVSPLKYSENDAKIIAEKIKKATSYQTDVTLLTGANMTKENIQKTLQSIKAKAGLEDKVIFYVSTHGKAVNGNLFLVPQNNKSVKNWINFEELFKEVQSISALDQIFVIDACESGKASDIMASVYDAKTSVLAKQSGVHVLMATTKGTFAFEHPDKNVQHGVFTYNILKALDDPKTDKNGDKWISVVELSKTLQEPANNTEHQFPIIRNVGQDTQIRKIGK